MAAIVGALGSGSVSSLAPPRARLFNLPAPRQVIEAVGGCAAGAHHRGPSPLAMPFSRIKGRETGKAARFVPGMFVLGEVFLVHTRDW